MSPSGQQHRTVIQERGNNSISVFKSDRQLWASSCFSTLSKEVFSQDFDFIIRKYM